MQANLAARDYNCVALCLPDDLQNTEEEAFSGARAFRDIFPSIQQLPFLMILGPNGKELVSLEGSQIAADSAAALHHADAAYPQTAQVAYPVLQSLAKKQQSTAIRL